MRDGLSTSAAGWSFAPLRPRAYDIVLADPPWRFATWSERGHGKSPQAHYGCMEMDDIAALPIGELVAARGVLVMWCTWPMLHKQLDLLPAWGLVQISGGAWAKRTHGGKLAWGTGYLQRSVCEPYVIAGRAECLGRTRINGRACPNLIETVCNSLGDVAIDGVRREHSRKPDEFYAMLDRLTGWHKRCELFARQRRRGWQAWGNEVEMFT